MPEIDRELCKGCGLCIRFCPAKVFRLSKDRNKNGYALPEITKAGACTGCGLCELTCPDFAINVDKNKKKMPARTGNVAGRKR